MKLSDFKSKEELNKFLYEVGICPQCLQPWVHECDEPFASCHCGSSEWAYQDIEKEPLLIQIQVQRYEEKRKQIEQSAKNGSQKID